MEVRAGSEEGFVREWTPCSHILNLIPLRIQNGIFSNELCLTCVDVVSEFIALGTNVGLVYWYDRKKGNIQRLRCEAATSPITYVKIVSTVDYMVGAGNEAGQVTVFQIPKEHPENIPDNFKPKVEPKVERYTIGDLHKSAVTAIEWSKNGMRLFSGDKNGVIIMTEIDFYMHLCKSSEIVNERHEIVQLSCHQGALLVASVCRAILCERRESRWHVTQLGNKERKSLCRLGGVLRVSCGRAVAAYCARAGARLWRADVRGAVLHTMMFKEAISNPLTIAELLNPSRRHQEPEHGFGPLYVYRDEYLVTHNDRILYILDPRSLTAVAVVEDLRRILSVAVNKDEIFILEGPRSLVRLAHAPEPAALAPDTKESANLMTKSLTTSIQQAVSTVRDITLDQVPYITSVLEQPIAIFTKNEVLENVVSGEECFELPPIRKLADDISGNVLESIVNEFKGPSEDEVRRGRSEELQRRLRMYDSIMERKYDKEVIHSRRSRSRSGARTPRQPTPVRSDVSYTSPCVMDVSVYGNLPQENDDELERQIEEKEKILAKMLNLDSLSISTPELVPEVNHQFTEKTINNDDFLAKPVTETEPVFQKAVTKKEIKKEEPTPIDLVPKLVQLPNNWNLGNIELDLDIRNVGKDGLLSPDDPLGADWEII